MGAVGYWGFGGLEVVCGFWSSGKFRPEDFNLKLEGSLVLRISVWVFTVWDLGLAGWA